MFFKYLQYIIGYNFTIVYTNHLKNSQKDFKIMMINTKKSLYTSELDFMPLVKNLKDKVPLSHTTS